MPCDHFTLQVPRAKFDELVGFLVSSLAHMGFKEHWRPVPQVVGLGEERPYLWISSLIPENTDAETVTALLRGNHMAFTAKGKCQRAFCHILSGSFRLKPHHRRRTSSAVP